MNMKQQLEIQRLYSAQKNQPEKPVDAPVEAPKPKAKRVAKGGKSNG